MEDIKLNFAKNLIALRKEFKLTQAELAEKINYSDKAISKWERGESVPDVVILKTIADMFGVTVDYLISDHSGDEPIIEQTAMVKHIKKKNRIFISILPLVALLAVATATYIALQVYSPSVRNAIYCYVLPLPIYALLALIFSAVWGNRMLNFLFVSLFVWLIIADVFFIVALATSNYYGLLFVIGAPAEIVIMVSFGIIKLKK